MAQPFPEIRIGNQSAFTARPLFAPFEFALDRGLEAFEWFPDKKADGGGWAIAEIPAADRDWIREKAAAHGVTLTVHAPAGLDLLEGPSGSGTLTEVLTFAREIEAVILNLHFQTEAGLPAFLEALEPWIHATAVEGMGLTLENTPATSPEDANRLFETLNQTSRIPSSHVGFCLDLGHANLCETTRNDYLGFIDRLSGNIPIRHLHLHENFGDRDSHLTLFTGPSASDDTGLRGLLERLKRRRYTGCAILEQWPDPPTLLLEARERLQTLWPGLKKRFTSEPSTEPSHGFIATLTKADQRCRSWREKLEWVENVLATPEADQSETLVSLALYLHWIRIGRIPCQEDQRHFRPSHHAQIAEAIHGHLERLASPDKAPFIRRIHPALPSFRSRFRQAEPLTRIRDIAHRNDIPKALKNEIKETLQNKLHRCAGPEDLQTSQHLLDRITREQGSYPPEFVAELERFHRELKEFFNAESLEDRLHELQQADLDPETAEAIDSFLRQKRSVRHSEETGSSHPDGLLRLLQAATGPRRRLIQGRPSETSLSQLSRLAEIDLENYSSTIVSELLNGTGEPNPGDRTLRLEALTLTLEQLGLSDIEPDECQALIAESRMHRDRMSTDPETLLGLVAFLQRCRRLYEGFADRLLGVVTPIARELGAALGVPRDERDLAGETWLRRHLMFQYSKLVTVLLHEGQTQAGLPGWETLVPGSASGRVIRLHRLSELPTDEEEDWIVFLEKAEGEEILPPQVRGIVLAHEIPHLSHLAVRARQARIPFVACLDPDQFPGLEPSDARHAALEAGEDKVTIRGGEPMGAPSHRDDPQTIRPARPIPTVSLDAPRRLLALSEVTAEIAGQKAAHLRQLEEVAHRLVSPPFDTLPTRVLPFGTSLKRGMPRDSSGPSAAAPRDPSLDPSTLMAEAEAYFGPGARLMVRSSSNLEDLEGWAGAGIYESVSHVGLTELPDAISRVRASLHSERARSERRGLGLSDDEVAMAIILQKMIFPDLAFFLQTNDPVTGDPDCAYAELVVGHGETLASGRQRGRPYRMVLSKAGDLIQTVAFANFSRALALGQDGMFRERVVDYSQQALTTDSSYRRSLGRRLAQVAEVVESAFQSPQEVEGVIQGETVYLVQVRPQPGGNQDPARSP